MQYILHRFLAIALLVGAISSLRAQDTLPLRVDKLQHIYDAVDVDSIVVTAARFDVQEFVRMVEADETFYLAFANLRHVSYKADNEVQCLTRLGKQKAAYRSRTEQLVDSLHCRTMTRYDEKISGKYYKGRKSERTPRYYTAQMYEKLFFTYGRVCQRDVLIAEARRRKKKKTGAMEHHITELKKLIFSPGKRADVPFIGARTEIFSKKMARFYNYRIERREYNGLDCHAFIIELKPQYKKRQQDKTVIKQMETYFEVLTHQVVGRSYHLRYDGIFSFNVKMQVDVTKLEDNFYVPTFIAYDGQWSVPTQDTEKCKFSMSLSDFRRPLQTAQANVPEK